MINSDYDFFTYKKVYGIKNNLFNSSVILPANVKIVFNNAMDKNSVNLTDNLFTYTKELSQDQYFGFILANK